MRILLEDYSRVLEGFMPRFIGGVDEGVWRGGLGCGELILIGVGLEGWRGGFGPLSACIELVTSATCLGGFGTFSSIHLSPFHCLPTVQLGLIE